MISTASNLTAGQGSPISQHLRATMKVLQEVFFDGEYVWNIKMCRVGGLTLKFAGFRRLSWSIAIRISIILASIEI